MDTQVCANHFYKPLCTTRETCRSTILAQNMTISWIHFAEFLEMFDRNRILASRFSVEAILHISYFRVIKVILTWYIFFREISDEKMSPFSRSPFTLSSFDFLLPGGSQGLNPGHQPWQQVSFHTKPSWWPHDEFILNLCRDTSVFIRLSIYLGIKHSFFFFPHKWLPAYHMYDFSLELTLNLSHRERSQNSKA